MSTLRRRVANLEPHWILLVGWLVVIAYAYPGYMNWDASEQLYQSRHLARIEDWHPAVMAKYWHVIEYVVHGPFGMLVLQTTLFLWGVYQLLCMRFQRRTSAWLTLALLWFPPILTPMSAVWKDAQMAGFLAAGLVLAMRPQRWKIALGCALLVLAAAVRDNAAAALPPLCLLIVAGWRLRRRVSTLAIAVGMFVVIVGIAFGANALFTQKRSHVWFRTVAMYDIAGSICAEDPMSDDEVRELIKGIPLRRGVTTDLQKEFCSAFTVRAWFSLSFGDKAMFQVMPTREDRNARRDAWKRIVREHTGAFLSHRWAVLREVLGITITPPWEPVCQTIDANADQGKLLHIDHSLSGFQEAAGKFFVDKISPTILYRPWAYALISLVLLAYALRRRDGFLAALLGSGLLYEASYFVGAAAPDFRYSHWMVVCCMLAATIIFGERLRAGRAARAA